ncbi:shikimate kinase [Olsenella sp. YH-ols2217]|uniref:Shikimate kinase n=1 Tax=Kribbibacterium absianum TaxID=3044210 RepID=A0ABT6ZIZ8_9ACTN|nr:MULTISPECIES: shikimate kinase [unclassified Olsenella]MDJ1121387.1 shikimate kinase [Olsenella sp. YH-ols2216]MDJ1128877.1 shikimate kinase [Olsenella sp. YH-ols2217]
MALDEESLCADANATDGYKESLVWRQDPGEDIAPAADAVACELADQEQARDAVELSRAAEGDAPFGLLGHPLGHSWSPAIHALLGSAPYALHDIPEDEVPAFVSQGTWQGLNVTIPYKRLAAQLADLRSPAVEESGAANTLVRLADGRVLAENTDVWGFDYLLGRFCELRLGASAAEVLRGRCALVLGTGGASRAVTFVLSAVGCDVVLVSRSGPGTYDGLAERHPDAALIVNTTPVGMFPACPASPLPKDALAAFPQLMGVIDLIYNPERTQLVMMAEELGVPAEGGLAMLVAQAYRSSELFQGRDLPDGLIDRIVATLHKQKRNVFFIGMPGCGKTGAARRMARMCQRPFVDLDDAFELEVGLSPAQVITEQGEDAFRSLETKILERYGKQSGLVVATGGGVVTRPINRDLMRQNGTVVFLDRPLEELSTAGRPLTEASGVERLAKQRMPLYRDWADLEIRCTGSAEGDAILVKELLGL